MGMNLCGQKTHRSQERLPESSLRLNGSRSHGDKAHAVLSPLSSQGSFRRKHERKKGCVLKSFIPTQNEEEAHLTRASTPLLAAAEGTTKALPLLA